MVLIEKAVERGQQAEEIKQLRGRLTNRASYYNIIGSSKAMQNIYEMIDSVAESDANILIIGESGTGKELIANAIHYKSLRAKKPFVKINCSALPKELIESELFGHTKGAFTGAAHRKDRTHQPGRRRQPPAGRDRRDAGRAPTKAAASVAGARLLSSWQREGAGSRFPANLVDQSRSARRDARRTPARGSLLSNQYD